MEVQVIYIIHKIKRFSKLNPNRNRHQNRYPNRNKYQYNEFKFIKYVIQIKT